MRILGIDPGYERLGIAVLEKSSARGGPASGRKEKVVFSECFKTQAGLPFPERLGLIGEKVKGVIKKYKPERLAIETLFLNTNQKTAMQVAEARGVVIYEATRAGLSVFEASPPQIKLATAGYGAANKGDIVKMVRLLVDIEDDKCSDDELDAIAITLTAFAHIRP